MKQKAITTISSSAGPLTNAQLDILDKLKKDIGRLSANGDAWTDVNSGEVLCYIDFDVDEVLLYVFLHCGVDSAQA